MALHDSHKRDIYPTNPNPRQQKSVVVAKFVDAIPESKRPPLVTKTHIFAAQDGVHEALEKAMQFPRKVMLLLEYREGAPSRRRTLAELRVLSMTKQGYTEANGWVVRAVDGSVYVTWMGQ
jgi:hypothetical protein